jgi:long-chain acyl-CoA synthetase
MDRGALDVSRVVGGARLLILGGTGFLGKLFWSMLVHRYPGIGRIYLVVRPKEHATPQQRFWSEVATAESLAPLRSAHGERFEDFLREKVVPIDGDMGRPLCGVDPTIVGELCGSIDAVVNVAGVIDFNPPLDDALHANAFGAQNLVSLARALGDARILHTSTCYVAGTRRGVIREEHPCVLPFPRASELGAELWDPEREIDECLDIIDQATQRCEDAFRQSEFAETAKRSLVARGEPTHGEPFERELARVKRKFVSDRLVEAGLDRATHWGWPNIYTYTKAIGEQVIAKSGLPFTIARPASCESTLAYPEPSYNEGISTSAPLIYLIMKGAPHILGKHELLDLIPADYVVAGMILALSELLEGTGQPVYQFGASDVNPCSTQRFGEIVGLYKRKAYREKTTGNLLVNALQARYEPVFVDRRRFDAVGPGAIAKATSNLASLVRKTAPALAPAARALEDVAKRSRKIAELQLVFEPFTSTPMGPFDCSNTRAAYGRLSEEDKAKLPWTPESIDWLDWMMNVHMPAMVKRVIPDIDRRRKREVQPRAAYPTLVSMLDEMAERQSHAVALQLLTDEGLTRTTFGDVKLRASATAARLAELGVVKGHRVVLSGRNCPDWAIAYFGILRAGATVVPLDPALDAETWRLVLADSRARVVLWDNTVESRDDVAQAHPALMELDLHAATADDAQTEPPAVTVDPNSMASLIYAGPATSSPKGVGLSHARVAALVAALAPRFPLSRGDTVVSVVPLHHTFEVTCGFLLPFSRGARVVYLGELSGDGIARGMELARPTAMVGVPALWQLLEHRFIKQVEAHGPVARAAFDVAADVSRWLASTVGVDVGRLLFGAVHAQFGGRMKWLISGSPSLPAETADFFASVGMRLTQAYGKIEVAPELKEGDDAIDENMGKRLGAEPDVADHALGSEGLGAASTERHASSDLPALPAPVQEVGRAFIGKLQDVFYGEVLKPRVYGRAHIPHNRNVIVVANHASHLDMGFVRYALGKYGEAIVSLAAQDYFFEGGVKRAFFENLTNLKPIDRKASLRQAIRQASEVIERGKTVLVFPEGTRSTTGEIQEFKPLVGHLALVYGIDILPIFLGGTHAAMPKGALVPTRREIVARIGPPLGVADLKRLTEEMSLADAAREVSRIARSAVLALSEESVLDLARAKGREDLTPENEHPLVKLFGELEAKFRAGEVRKPVSFYFSLGNDERAKWTVRVDASACDVRPGKPEGGQADCVLKTSPEIFAKIVRESYVPSPADFLSGVIKSNDVALLLTFQKVFRLDQSA